MILNNGWSHHQDGLSGANGIEHVPELISHMGPYTVPPDYSTHGLLFMMLRALDVAFYTEYYIKIALKYQKVNLIENRHVHSKTV